MRTLVIHPKDITTEFLKPIYAPITNKTVITGGVDNIYIWCHASHFMAYNQLCGFGSGMFISELNEAHYFNYGDVDWDIIEESNYRFSTIVGKYIDEPLEMLFDYLIVDYGSLARTNPIARFNIERLYYTISERYEV
ncbi:MAG: hypothetical protein ACQERU_10225, partial [Bacteroidota bacterium]